jgi:hypothetical protein
MRLFFIFGLIEALFKYGYGFYGSLEPFERSLFHLHRDSVQSLFLTSSCLLTIKTLDSLEVSQNALAASSIPVILMGTNTFATRLRVPSNESRGDDEKD